MDAPLQHHIQNILLVSTMDCAPKLEKLRSCFPCPALLTGRWCSKDGRRQIIASCLSRRGSSGGGGDEFEFDHSSRSEEPRWQTLWKKFKKEICPSPASIRAPYDPYTYSQNFDEGLTWLEPDNLSRSFSMRFAAYPSARFHEIG